MFTAWLVCSVFLMGSLDESLASRSVAVPLDDRREVAVDDLVRRLAKAGNIEIQPPRTRLALPFDGVSGVLSRSLLSDCLGSEFAVQLKSDSVVLTFPSRLAGPEGRAELQSRLRLLANRAEQAARGRLAYGMRALASYRPNDPNRPTVCLVHGLNSSSGGFVHMIRPLEEAGYGVVVFDYPFNRPLDESCDRFRRAWREYRKQAGETRPWAILAHSMGSLLARSLVEEEGRPDRELGVASLIMIAPVNQGAHIAKLQGVIQLISGIRAIGDDEQTRAFSALSDGIGLAAQDLLPGSRFLQALNRNRRRAGVGYHILAGDSGFVTRELRRRVEGSLGAVSDAPGFLGKLARVATGDIPALLDEVSDGTGDGAVAVEATKLGGVSDHRTIHANHAELIRAPILFADPGPVACMPYVLKWLRADLPQKGMNGPDAPGEDLP